MAIILPKKRTSTYPSVVAGVYFTPKSSSSRLKKFLRTFQPLSEKTPESNKLRRQTFHTADGNGSGYCSLADIDNFVSIMLKKMYDDVEGQKLFMTFRPSYIRAFTASKALAKSSSPSKISKVDEDDYVTFSEFRILNAYLCIYASMFYAFSKIDGAGVGDFDMEDDRRISKEEWLKSFATVHDSGFVGLECIENEIQATAAFDKMDLDGKGVVLFSEFCEYIKATEFQGGTDLGKLLSEKVMPIQPKATPTKTNTGRPLSAGSSSNNKPIIIAEGFYVGRSSSPELLDFLRVFEPLTGKTNTGKKDRLKHFQYADQNASGYVSLAELESFIKRKLSTSFTAHKAKDLFRRFRKSYIKAYQGAKSLHDTSGKGVGDDYVTFAEFRIFNVLLCVYATLLDAFCRINESSDTIDVDEFLQAYNNVRDYGFAALYALESANDARSAFNVIDGDGSNQVSYSEWCEYIINFEIENHTELGNLIKL